MLCTDKESFVLYPFMSFMYLLKATVNLKLLMLSIANQYIQLIFPRMPSLKMLPSLQQAAKCSFTYLFRYLFYIIVFYYLFIRTIVFFFTLHCTDVQLESKYDNCFHASYSMGWLYGQLPGKWVLVILKKEKISGLKSIITKFYTKVNHFLLFQLCFGLALVKSD